MSWQARLLAAVLRRTLRPMMARDQSPQQARRRMDALMTRTLRPPPYTLTLPAELGVPGLWVSNRRTDDGIVLYFHGGGYFMGSSSTHMALAAMLARDSGARVFLPDYRLAPEHPFPAAFDDALAAFDALVARGHDPSRIVLGGDSAGGGLALALMSHLCQEGRPPAGLFAFSPWTDLTFSGASLVTNSRRDQMLPSNRLTEVRAHILGGSRPGEASDPRLSPLHAGFPNPPPVLIHVAETEILRDDALRMRSRLPDAEIRVAGDLPHVWPLFHTVLPEARATIAQTGAFIRSSLAPPSDGN